MHISIYVNLFAAKLTMYVTHVGALLSTKTVITKVSSFVLRVDGSGLACWTRAPGPCDPPLLNVGADSHMHYVRGLNITCEVNLNGTWDVK